MCGATLAAVMLAGCAGTPSKVVPTAAAGPVNLDRLVRLNPMWSRVAAIDDILAALPRDSGLSLAQEPSRAYLAAETQSTDTNAPGERTAGDLATEKVRLSAVRDHDARELAERLTIARDYRLSVETYAWNREAAVRVHAEQQAANAEYAAEYAAAMQDRTIGRLNLQLRVYALENLVSGWLAVVQMDPRLPAGLKRVTPDRAALDRMTLPQVSALASAMSRWSDGTLAPPMVVADAKELVAGRTALERMTGDQVAALAALDRENAANQQRAVDEGIAYVAQQRRQQDVELLRSDAVRVAAEERRLRLETNSVLSEVAAVERRVWIKTAMPGSISVKYHWPAAAPAAQNDVRSRLLLQRAHWLEYVYDDTRAAAIDVAAQKHWRLQFTQHAAGSSDLTQRVAQVLKETAWKTGSG